MPTYNDQTIGFGFDYSHVVAGMKEMDKFISNYKIAGNNGLLSKEIADRTKIIELLRKEVALGNQARGTTPRKPRNKEFSISEQKAGQMGMVLEREMMRRQRMLGSDHKTLAGINAQYEKLKANISKINSQEALNKHQRNVELWRQKNIELTQASNKMTGLRKITNGFNSSLNNLLTSYISVFAVVGTGVGLIRTGKQFENVSAVMLQASGNAQQAAKDFAFVRAMSSEMGLGLTETAESYAKFAVAARSGGVSIEESNQMFRDFGITLRATGLTSDKAGLAFLALRQMLSGAVIQGQEMNQIIDQLPQVAAAANKAVKSMGFNVDNYKKAVETGTVESKEFVRQIIATMKQASVETGAYEAMVESLTAAEGRFKLAIQESSNEIFKTGRLNRSLALIMDGLAGIVQALTPALTTMAFGFNVVVEGISAVIGGANEAVKALGMDGGLASIIAFLVGPLGVLLLISRMKALVDVMRTFTMVQKLINNLKKNEIVYDTIKAAINNPLAAAVGVGVAGAAAYGVAKTVSNITNHVSNEVNIEANGADAQEVADLVLDNASLGLGVQ